MRRLSLTTRAFLLSFIPICFLLGTSFWAINTAVHQKIRQDLREALQSSDQLLNRASAEFARQNSALLAKLTDSAGLKASVGLLAEADKDPSARNQVRSTIEAQLWEFQNASLYDFLAISDLHGRTVAAIPLPQTPSRPGYSISSQSALTQAGLEQIQGVLFQVQSVPIEIAGETAAVLTLGRRFDLERLAVGDRAVLFSNGRVVRSTFPPQENARIERDLSSQCPNFESGCEVSIAGESYVVSILQRAQLGPGYRLLGFRSLDVPLRAFNRAFIPTLVEIGLGGVLFALVSTLLTSHSVSQPLRRLASQLQIGATSGVLPERLESVRGVREVDLVVDAFNRVAEAERHSRSELILAKQAAEAANRLKTEFLTNVSHELRTPLNGVLGMTDLLESTTLTEEQTEYATTLRTSGRSLISLIDDMLDFSELEMGRFRLRPSQFELRRVVNDAAAVTQARAAKMPISVETRYADCIPQFFFADETRIRQVLMHLCNNAVKFTQAGFIRISADCMRATDREVELKFSVADTGIGIAPDKLDMIFQQFTQVDGSLTRRQGGTGIGLSIAKAIVELMGGRMSVESRPGVGSIFSFILPLKLLQRIDEGSLVHEFVETQ